MIRGGLPYLLLGLLALLPLGAHADCRYQSGGNTSVTFTGLPSTIMVPANAAIGQVLASSAQASPANPPTVVCGRYLGPFWVQGSETLTYGVSNSRGGYSADNVTYETGIAGIGYRITHPTDYLTPYPLNSESVSSTVFSVTSGIELVKTGTIQSGGTVAAGKLGDWRWGSLIPETFFLGNSVTFTTPSCDLVTNPINVTLPPVTTSAFTGVGATAGNTPFQINLNCPAGVSVGKVTMHAAQPDSHTGVIRPAGTGYAAGIGVRVLDNNMNAVVFEQPMSVTPNATGSIPFYAQYFQTASTVSGGNVKATVTFDIYYQ